MIRLSAALLTVTLILQGAVAYKVFWSDTPPPPRGVARKVASGTVIQIRGLPTRGSARARIAVIEFVDFQCPFCKRHASGVQSEIMKAFVEPGRVQYLIVNYPLERLHPSARLMATAAICADEQKRYWEMHGQLFATQPTTPAFVLAVGRDLNLDTSAFSECVNGGDNARRAIDRDSRIAESLGIQGTPAFAVGSITSDARVSVSTVIDGAQPFTVFEETITDLESTTGHVEH